MKYRLSPAPNLGVDSIESFPALVRVSASSILSPPGQTESDGSLLKGKSCHLFPQLLPPAHIWTINVFRNLRFMLTLDSKSTVLCKRFILLQEKNDILVIMDLLGQLWPHFELSCLLGQVDEGGGHSC